MVIWWTREAFSTDFKVLSHKLARDGIRRSIFAAKIIGLPAPARRAEFAEDVTRLAVGARELRVFTATSSLGSRNGVRTTSPALAKDWVFELCAPAHRATEVEALAAEFVLERPFGVSATPVRRACATPPDRPQPLTLRRGQR